MNIFNNIKITIYTIITLIVILIYTSFAWGVVLKIFWVWFIMPVFTNLPILTLKHAVGIMFFIGLFNNNYTPSSNTNDFWIKTILNPWLVAFSGWIVYLIYI